MMLVAEQEAFCQGLTSAFCDVQDWLCEGVPQPNSQVQYVNTEVP